jgi:disulfide bond formation protein DsbB
MAPSSIFGLTRRQWNLLGGLACAGMMGFALYAQYVLHLAPCNMCVLQRIAVVALGSVFLLAAAVPGHILLARASAFAIGAVALLGVAVASWHVWIQLQPIGSLPSCGADFYTLVDMFGFYDAVTRVLSGGGDCQAITWSLFGLSMPVWVVVSVALLGCGGAVVNWRLARRH